jgi:proteasome lid subunit RPN8/RPN11
LAGKSKSPVHKSKSLVGGTKSLYGDDRPPIRIAAAVLDDVFAHAREAAPRECCGLLLGSDDRIVESVRTRNVAQEATRFLVDPSDHIAGRRHARDRGLDVVGFYHSHPHSSAAPSERDRKEAGYPDHLYLIASLGVEAPPARLFRLAGGNFLEVPFVRLG